LSIAREHRLADFAYVDETGIDGVSPLMVMVGIVVNDERLNRTQGEFAAIFENLGELVSGTLKELKYSDMLAGAGLGGRSTVRSAET